MQNEFFVFNNTNQVSRFGIRLLLFTFQRFQIYFEFVVHYYIYLFENLLIWFTVFLLQ